MKELKDSERNLINEGLVMVDYSAEWCGGCQVIKPIVENQQPNMKEKLIFMDVMLMNVQNLHQNFV